MVLGSLRDTATAGAELRCYAADEIPEWPLFERSFPAPAEHVVTIDVLGQPDARSTGTRVWLDAISIEP